MTGLYHARFGAQSRGDNMCQNGEQRGESTSAAPPESPATARLSGTAASPSAV